jgi:hypothetical protein
MRIVWHRKPQAFLGNRKQTETNNLCLRIVLSVVSTCYLINEQVIKFAGSVGFQIRMTKTNHQPNSRRERLYVSSVADL